MKRRLLFIAVVASVLALVLAGCDKFYEQEASPTPRPPVSDEEALAAMQVIEERVSELRGLEARRPVNKAFMGAEELRERIREDFFEDLTEQEVRDEELLYVAFEFIEPELDLYQLYLDLYTEQVAGFYDPETEELYLIKGDEAPGAMERSTFSHEYVHALQDQHYDLEALGFTNQDVDVEEETDSERDFAVQSLVEGDATLVQQQYLLQYFDADDLSEMLAQLDEMDMSVLESAPPFLSELLLFPYEAGLGFVSALYADGGWPAVDDAYENLPLSTEQILHPSRYPDDAPQTLTLPPLTDTLGSGWRLVDEDVIGEFALQLYLDVYLDRAEADDAAEGWGGDRYAVYWREDESAFVLLLRLAWDTPAEADEFVAAYEGFAGERFGTEATQVDPSTRRWSGEDVLLLAQNGQHETLIIIAPDETTLQAVYDLLQ